MERRHGLRLLRSTPASREYERNMEDGPEKTRPYSPDECKLVITPLAPVSSCPSDMLHEDTAACWQLCLLRPGSRSEELLVFEKEAQAEHLIDDAAHKVELLLLAILFDVPQQIQEVVTCLYTRQASRRRPWR